MQLTAEQIKEFQKLYKSNFGIEIDTDVALAKGLQLIRLVEIVAKHKPDSSHDEITH